MIGPNPSGNDSAPLPHLKATDGRAMAPNGLPFHLRLSAAGEVLHVNEAFARRSGLTREEVVGSSYRLLLFPEDSQSPDDAKSADAIPSSVETRLSTGSVGGPQWWQTFPTGIPQTGSCRLRTKEGTVWSMTGVAVPAPSATAETTVIDLYARECTALEQAPQTGRSVVQRTGTDIDLSGPSHRQIEKLREAEELRSALEEHSILSIADRRGKIIDVNTGFCHISGYSRDELLGQDHRILNSGYHPPGFWKNVWKTISRGSCWRGEVCNKRRDGSLYWVDTTIVPSLDDDGKVAKYVSLRFDITSQKAAERDFELLRKALDENLMISISDRDGVILEVNPGLCRESGYTREELVGNKISVLDSPDYSSGFWKGVGRQLRLRKVWRGEVRDRRKDGSYYWVDCTVVPFEGSDGKIDRYVCLRFDINASKQSQRKLQEAQALVEQTGRLAKIGGWEVDLENKQPIWSPQVYRIHEVEDHIQADLSTALDFYPPGAREVITEAVKDAMEQGKPWDLELPFITAKGNHRWVRTIGLPEFQSGRCVKLWGAFQDITESRNAQRKLRELTRRLETATDGAGVGIWEYRPASEEMIWDRAAARIFGAGARKDESPYEVMRRSLLKEDWQRIRSLFQKSKNTAAGFETTVSIRRGDGQTRYIHLSATHEPTDEGAARFVGTMTDITDKHLAEDRLRTAMRISRIGLWDWDIRSGECFVSHSFCEMLGYAPDSLPTTFDGWKALLHPEDHADSLREIDRHLSGETSVYRHEQRIRCMDGTYRWIQDVGEAVEFGADGNPVRMIGIYTDVQEFKEISSRLELAISSANAGLWDWNIQTGDLVTNELYFKMLGDEVPDGDLDVNDFIDRLHPDDSARTMAAVQTHFKDGSIPFDVEFRFRCGDGSYKWIHSTGNVIERASDGTPVRMIGQHADVDAHRRATENVAKLNDELAAQIGYAQELASRAEAANKAKSEFLANMSHEIRTPMTAILGFAETLHEYVADPVGEAAVQTIHRNGEHLLTVINDILDLSKIESGEFQIEYIECSPSEILLEVQQLMQVRADSKQIGLAVSIEDEIPSLVRTDPTRLRQILLNLVGNAIKFTDSGSVSLTCRVPDTGSTDQLQFEICDSGIGMNREQIEGLFQPFVQADTSMSRRFGGTGLGLTISKRFANLLGGTITVQSEPDKGSTFKVTITAPASEDSRRVTKLSDPAPTDVAFGQKRVGEKALDGIRILLVEDGPDNQRLISFLLRKAGAIVDIAADGLVGHNATLDGESSGEGYDVILMDMQMPVMDGYTATTKLREAGFEKPIIALTAHAMTHDRRKCLEAGCADFATKPIEHQKLIETILRQTRTYTAVTPRP